MIKNFLPEICINILWLVSKMYNSWPNIITFLYHIFLLFIYRKVRLAKCETFKHSKLWLRGKIAEKLSLFNFDVMI